MSAAEGSVCERCGAPAVVVLARGKYLRVHPVCLAHYRTHGRVAASTGGKWVAA